MAMPSWIKHFKWQSVAQEKGTLAFIKWLRDCQFMGLDGLPYHPDDLVSSIDPSVLFFTQALHENNLYWLDTIETQVSGLQKEIASLRDQMLLMKVDASGAPH